MPDTAVLPPKSTIAAKMVSAMKAIDAVTKSGVNATQNYKYVKAADVAHAVRGVLAENGIMFTYSIAKEDRWATDRFTKEGTIIGHMNYVSLHVDFSFTDADSGDSVSLVGLGWGSDTGDKAPYKAMTGALKYLLRMNFIIPDEMDPENEEKSVREEVEKQKAKARTIADNAKPPAIPIRASGSHMEGNILTATVSKIETGIVKSTKKEYRIIILDSAAQTAFGLYNKVFVWHQSMWDSLESMVGKECEFMVATSDKGITLNTILRIGAIDWTEPVTLTDSLQASVDKETSGLPF